MEANYSCTTCGATFGRSTNLLRHIRTQHSTVVYDCCYCNYQSCRRLDSFKNHIINQHSDKKDPNGLWTCGRCGWELTDYGFFDTAHECLTYAYSNAVPLPTVEPLPIDVHPEFHEDPEELTVDHPLWEDPFIAPVAGDEAAVDILFSHWPIYRQHFRTADPLVHMYTYRLAGMDVSDFSLDSALEFIYLNVGSVWNWNCGLTVLLKRVSPSTMITADDEDPPYRIFIAENNRANLLERNPLVHNLASLQISKGQLSEAIEKAVANQERPNTRFRFVAMLSITFYIHIRPNYVSGVPGRRQLPSFLTRNNHLLSMESDQDWHPYKDNLCAFRCLLAATGGDHNDVTSLHKFYDQYRRRVNGAPPKVFRGVKDSDIPVLEEVYGVRIQVFRQSEAKKPVVVIRIVTKDDDTPLVNLHSHLFDAKHAHFSLITDLNGFAGRYICDGCGAVFKRKKHRDRHVQNNCNNGDPVSEYVGGTFSSGVTIWDRLLEYGIEVESERRVCKLLSVWDCEAALESVNDLMFIRRPGDDQNDRRLRDWQVDVEHADVVSKIQVRQKHVVVGTAIASSVPTFEEPQFFHGPDPAALVLDVFEAMKKIADKQYEIMREQFDSELSHLQTLKEQAQEQYQAANGDKKMETASLNKISRLLDDMDKYCRVATFIGYNCGRYDLKLIKQYLYGNMVKDVRAAKNNGEEGQTWPSAISRSGQILCISGYNIRFIDLCAYLPPATPLSKFVTTFTDGALPKGCFPYESVTKYSDLLDITQLPPKEAFRSILKCNKDIADEDYAEAQRVWEGLPEKNLLQFMAHYNIRDCVPTLTGALNMQALYYREFGGIDIFRECVSIPSFTLKYLFNELTRRHPTVRFHLFEPDQANLHKELAESIVGGLSMIGKRMAFSGETPVRSDVNFMTKAIIGYDVNALYLNSFRHPQPTGHADWWQLQQDGENFVRITKTIEARQAKRKSWGEVEFLKYISWLNKIHIHTAEDGRQVRLGIKNFRADGWCKEKKTVIFYEGCRWHRHPETGECLTPEVVLDGVNPDIRKMDAARNQELESLGIKVAVYSECQFKMVKYVASLLRKDKPISDPLHQVFHDDAADYNRYLMENPKRKFCSRAIISYQKMAESVFDGSVFGYVKCSKIETPERLKEKFSDFPPIIHHTDVSLDQLDPYMRGRCEAAGVLKKPRDCVVAGFSARDIWIFSPLVRFYERIGMEIEISQVAQYDPITCFRFFMDSVTQYRKDGDTRPELAAQAEVAKLIGNSAYGKTLMNPYKQQEVRFMDAAATGEAHRSPYHHRTIPLAEDLYEVHMRKKSIYHNLPMVIGLATYGYAKLAMLEFWYDVLLEFADRRKFNLCCTDTDSLYLCLSESTLDECIVPEKRFEWESQVKPKWLVLDASQKREPGLLKVEASGTDFVGLCPKMYILYDAEKDTTKAKAKGVQARRNSDLLTIENYRRILLNEPDANSTAFNITIRSVNNVVCTAVTEKAGLTGIYIKRRCVDPIQWGNTIPIDM